MKSFTVCFICLMMVVFCTSAIAQINWEKYKDNPTMQPGSAGEWDANLGPGCVIFDGTTYHQWYGGAADGASFNIGYASSPDGITWTKDTLNNPVLEMGNPESWDDTRLSDPYVLYVNNMYHMWYGGHDGQNFSIGYATSPDGVNWSKYENNPVMTRGAVGSWMELHVLNPCVRFDGDTYHMWFTGENDYLIQNIGYATSSDGINWTQYAENPVLQHGETGTWDQQVVQAPTVIFDGDRYHMWFNGVDNPNWWQWQIGYASAPDETSWTKYTGNPVLTPSIGDWDSQYVGFCSVVLETFSNQFKMWYGGGDSDWSAKGGYAEAPQSILHVPDHFASIQEGIDAADDTDVVLVDEDTYYENINFKGKAITVASHFWFDGDTSHISNTIIDGSQPSNPDSGSVVHLSSGEDTTSVLCGFTITGGTGTYVSAYDGYSGGGIMGTGKIIHNKIIKNTVSSLQKQCIGGGLVGLLASPKSSIILEDNEFTNNSNSSPIMGSGGGVFIKCITKNGGYILIRNNIITENTVSVSGSYKAIGGGIGLAFDLPASADATIENNIIAHNELHCVASMGAGIYVVYWSDRNVIINDDTPTPCIANNLIYDNYSQDRGGGIGVWTVGLNTQSNITPQPVIINNTIANNRSNDGCGIFNFNSYPLLINNILWNDLSIPGSFEIFNDDIFYPDYWPTTVTNEGILYIYYSDIQGGWEGEENIDSDPLFADTINYYLSEQSPCIDAGHDSSIFNDVEVGGMAVWPAMETMRNDMGAYGGNPDSIYKYVMAVDDPSGQNTYVPLKHALNQNYPNPFNPSTTIEFTLPKSEFVELKVFNLLGQEVSTLISNKLYQGNHTYQFDGKNLASGIYYYQLVAGDYRQVKKMILIK